MKAPNTLGPKCRAMIEEMRAEHGSLLNVAIKIDVSYWMLVALMGNRRGVGMKTAMQLRDGLSLPSIEHVFK